MSSIDELDDLDDGKNDIDIDSQSDIKSDDNYSEDDYYSIKEFTNYLTNNYNKELIIKDQAIEILKRYS